MPAEYRFELGIDWNAIPRPNTLAFLQTGFVDMDVSSANPTPIVASPVKLQPNTTLGFVIFDTTTSSSANTAGIESIAICSIVASTTSTNDEPFPVSQSNVNFVKSHQKEASIAFKDDYWRWETGLATSIAQVVGRYRITITVTARKNDGTLMTWSDDPEMMVGETG